MKKWYVFDMYNCFGEFDTIFLAADYARSLTKEGRIGVTVWHLSHTEMLQRNTILEANRIKLNAQRIVEKLPPVTDWHEW